MMIRILIILFTAQLVAQTQVDQNPNIVFIISENFLFLFISLFM